MRYERLVRSLTPSKMDGFAGSTASTLADIVCRAPNIPGNKTAVAYPQTSKQPSLIRKGADRHRGQRHTASASARRCVGFQAGCQDQSCSIDVGVSIPFQPQDAECHCPVLFCILHMVVTLTPQEANGLVLLDTIFWTPSQTLPRLLQRQGNCSSLALATSVYCDVFHPCFCTPSWRSGMFSDRMRG